MPAKDDVDASQIEKAESIVMRARTQRDDEKLAKCMNSEPRPGQHIPHPGVTAIFSSCVHCDVSAFKSSCQAEDGTKLLPLHSRLRREQMTQNEEAAINLRFIDAVEKMDLSRLGEALDLGADINTSDEHGTPALLCSILNLSYHSGLIATFLLSYQDLNVHARDSRGRTALHASVIIKQPALVRFFAAQGR